MVGPSPEETYFEVSPSQMGDGVDSYSNNQGDDHHVPAEEEMSKVGENIVALSIATVMACILFCFLVWCIYDAYIVDKMKNSRSQQQSVPPPLEETSTLQDETTSKLSRQERKVLLFAYFDRSGNQMVRFSPGFWGFLLFKKSHSGYLVVLSSILKNRKWKTRI